MAARLLTVAGYLLAAYVALIAVLLGSMSIALMVGGVSQVVDPANATDISEGAAAFFVGFVYGTPLVAFYLLFLARDR